MKELPVIFNAEMIRAIQSGRKTQTRRTMRVQPTCGPMVRQNNQVEEWMMYDGKKSPFGQPGCVLAVRETHYLFGHWVKNGTSKTGKQKWKFIHKKSKGVRYLDNPPDVVRNGRHVFGWYKRPSIFMPMWAVRIKLPVKRVWVERVQDISEADAIKEGIEHVGGEFSCSPWRNYMIGKEGEMNCHCSYSVRSFQTLWDSIYGTWDENPYVWCCEFEVKK